jgi:hypothetical protein
MSFDLVPAELLASALIAVLLAVPLSFVLAAAAIAGPRRTWNRAGLGMGLGLLLGVIAAAAGAMALAPGQGASLSGLVLLLGLLCAIAAGVLVIVLKDGTGLSAAVGIVACVLIGLGEPGQTLPAMFGLSSSFLVVFAGVVVEAVAMVLLVGALVGLAGRVWALQIGVAAAGIVGGVLIAVATVLFLLHEVLGGPVPQLPQVVTLVATLAALVIGSVVGGVLTSVRSRRQVAPADAAR